MQSPLPQFLKPYFWDVKFSELSSKKYPEYIVERILEFGSLDAFKWLRKTYSKSKILEVLDKSRRISLKSRTFYKSYYESKR